MTAHDLFYQEGIRATGIDRIIAQSGVTKVTFYRHFPSKNDLILEYLEYRHRQWMAWFTDALQRHGGSAEAILPVLSEWFSLEEYRGCAFINAVGELGEAFPEIVKIAQRHKQEMTDVINELMPSSEDSRSIAEAVAVAVDGAIVRAQFDQTPGPALTALAILLEPLHAVRGRQAEVPVDCRISGCCSGSRRRIS